ncbi:Uu.00g070920.m01.CDS01 [Anthostomella pinea]|uniref:Uu.00g070920.m01.CDS01 n=1 Tax=Anthostomella pinea TaxID=933095 RepID=A0AAI8VUT3_9PEZI|nr:Uu.00g070920.m01.CDS01 [Anthostomella pinea]
MRFRTPLLETGELGQLGDRTVDTAGGAESLDSFTTRIVARENDISEKPATGSSNTLPIVLGIVIPLALAMCVLFYLHRRTTKKQKQEDETDKYKSMDFGLDVNHMPDAGNKRRSAFFGKEKDAGHNKGQLSMDMNLSSPYLLPPTLQQSRESLNSLTKTLHQHEDPYRPIASYAGSDVGSLRSFQPGGQRDSSLYNKKRFSGDRDSKARSFTTETSPLRSGANTPSPLSPLPPAAQPPQRQPVDDVPAPVLPAKNEFRFVDEELPVIQEPAAVASQTPRRAASQESPLLNESHGPIHGRDSMSSANVAVGGLGITDSRFSHGSSGTRTTGTNSVPPRKDSMPVIDPIAIHDYQAIAHQLRIDVPSPSYDEHDELHMGIPREDEYPHSAGLAVPAQNGKRLSVGLRPLPPDDFLESEDPEFRANRIRSFYKEYFDDSKVDHSNAPPMPQRAQYHEDYDANYLGEAAYFDPESNAFVMPYAQPVTRRAMTPPPKNRRPMPGSRPRGPQGPPGSRGDMSMAPPQRPRAGSTMSAGGYGPRSPRPGSSASSPRFGGKPKKALPPPSALSTLPTPSKLRDDSFALLGAIDFAPPPTFADQAAGRSQSPVGERRPYAVNTPVHSPLVSAFDETAALPSPHHLRKSGTFTGLDFAPPRRFKDADSMSETGSIRSNRSGISTVNLNAIRNGAGRVSRLPGDTIFTQAAMSKELKPEWGMRN